jgi:hypothetical protein
MHNFLNFSIGSWFLVTMQSDKTRINYTRKRRQNNGELPEKQLGTKLTSTLRSKIAVCK